MIDKNRLAEKCSTWNISLSPAQLDQLDHYAEILVSYNEKVNLTAITSPEGIEDRHFADSLLFAAQPEVQGKMVDVGTGAGFPGIVAKIYKLHQQNISFRSYRRILINENKWRASRYGIDAELIDFGKEIAVPYEKILDELLEFIDDVVDELDCRKEVEYAREIVKMGTGADRKIKVYNETGDLKKVVDYMIAETEFGLF